MRSIFTILLTLIVSATTFAQTNSLVQDNVGYAGSLYYFHQRKVARATNGTLLVTWTTKATAGGQVMYSTYDPAFQQWSPPVALSNAASAGVAIQSALAADEQGNIHATWQQTPSLASPVRYQIFYSKFNGSSWTTPKKISLNDNETCEEATVEVDSKGYIWAVYNNDGAGVGKEWIFGIKSTDGGTTWSTAADTLFKGGTLGTSIEVARTALAAGPSGRLVALWDNSLAGSSARRETYVNQYDGTTWQGEVRISDTTSADRDHNRYGTITMDNQSNIYAFYVQDVISATDTRLRKVAMHKKAWSDTWSTKATLTIDSSPISFRDFSAVSDSSGVVHFTYRRDIAADTSYGLDEMVYTFSKNAGLTWSTPIVLSRPNRDGGYATIANRVRRAYGIDFAWRESRDVNKNDQDTTAVLYGNVPYRLVTAVEASSIPSSFDLVRNYPNPFNPTTTIEYQVATRGHVTLGVFDALGREVKTLMTATADAGSYKLTWDGRDNTNRPLSSGVYFVRLQTVQSSQLVVATMLVEQPFTGEWQ
jgi:hypothetical protein